MKNQRESNKSIAEETLAILEKGYFMNPKGEAIDIGEVQRAAEAGTVHYTPALSDELLKLEFPDLAEPTIFEHSRETTMTAARRLVAEGHTDLVLLNFASAKNAGGGFLGGSQAQEESIARASGLYPCLLRAPNYYAANRHEKSMFYTDNMIYSPKVPIFKDEAGENLPNYVLASMITAPAVNRGAMKIKADRPNKDIEIVMRTRIAKVLAMALAQGHTTILLGAWGCGVFQNLPADMARYFRDVIAESFARKFKKIIFAVYSPKDEAMYEAFLIVDNIL